LKRYSSKREETTRLSIQGIGHQNIDDVNLAKLVLNSKETKRVKTLDIDGSW